MSTPESPAVGGGRRSYSQAGAKQGSAASLGPHCILRLSLALWVNQLIPGLGRGMSHKVTWYTVTLCLVFVETQKPPSG